MDLVESDADRRRILKWIRPDSVLDVEEADILQHFDKCGQFIARVRTRCSFRSTALFC